MEVEAESLQSELLPPQRSSQELGPWTQLTQRVRRSSASGSSVASLRFSKLILSRGLWFQAKSTASWKVVTSRSYWPTSFLKVIWKHPPRRRRKQLSDAGADGGQGSFRSCSRHPEPPPRRSRRTHDSVGHQVMPVELPAAVVLLVEVLHLWDEVFQLRRKGDEDLLAAPRPRSSIQDLDVDGVGWRVTAQLAAQNSQTLTSTEPGAELSRSLRKT